MNAVARLVSFLVEYVMMHEYTSWSTRGINTSQAVIRVRMEQTTTLLQWRRATQQPSCCAIAECWTDPTSCITPPAWRHARHKKSKCVHESVTLVYLLRHSAALSLWASTDKPLRRASCGYPNFYVPCFQTTSSPCHATEILPSLFVDALVRLLSLERLDQATTVTITNSWHTSSQTHGTHLRA
jgi:hypothetical protein